MTGRRCDRRAAYSLNRSVNSRSPLTREMVLRVTGDREFTERFKEYAARLSQRLPVINEVNREQVELLRRFRSAQDEAQKEDVKVPLLISISCIAAGLGATG